MTATKSGEPGAAKPQPHDCTNERWAPKFRRLHNFCVHQALGKSAHASKILDVSRTESCRTQRVQVNGASLRLFLRSSTRPNRAFEPQSLGRVRDPVRIAEGPTHDFGFSILDCGPKQHESHCRKRLCGERGSSSIAFMRGERTGPPTLWYLGNVDGPRCHANQVVPATGLVDDALTRARKKGIVDQAGSLTYFPAGVMVFQQFDDVSLMAA